MPDVLLTKNKNVFNVAIEKIISHGDLLQLDWMQKHSIMGNP